jgi:hypothetical protein
MTKLPALFDRFLGTAALFAFSSRAGAGENSGFRTKNFSTRARSYCAGFLSRSTIATYA